MATYDPHQPKSERHKQKIARSLRAWHRRVQEALRAQQPADVRSADERVSS